MNSCCCLYKRNMMEYCKPVLVFNCHGIITCWTSVFSLLAKTLPIFRFETRNFSKIGAARNMRYSLTCRCLILSHQWSETFKCVRQRKSCFVHWTAAWGMHLCSVWLSVLCGNNISSRYAPAMCFPLSKPSNLYVKHSLSVDIRL